MNALQIANWFLCKESMHPKKVQLLTYYTYFWYLALMNDNINELNQKLFEENILSWARGPMIPSIYHEFEEYGGQKIPQLKQVIEIENENILDILNQIWTTYGHFDNEQLESIVLQEEPWNKARKNLAPLKNGTNPITNEMMFDYYLSQIMTD